LGEMESVPNSYPGKVIDDAVQLGILTQKDADLIWHNNVLKWLG